MVANFTQSFDIRNFTSILTPSHKGTNKFICPVCGGSNLHINPSTGAYKCWTNECDAALIREAVAPLGNKQKPAKSQLKLSFPGSIPPIPTDNLTIGMLAEPGKLSEARERGNLKQTKYIYSEDQFVIRSEYFDNGIRTKKTFTPHHLNSKGEAINKKGDKLWPLYKIDDVLKYGQGTWINEAEGEKCAEYLATLGFIAVSSTGTANEKDLEYGYKQLADAGIAGIVYHQDNDTAGENKANKHKKIANILGIPFVVVPIKQIWQDCPDAGDIADAIDKGIFNADSLTKQLQIFINIAAKEVDQGSKKPALNNVVNLDDVRKKPLVSFNQKAFDQLYEDQGYVVVDGQFYKWRGNYYQKIDNGLEMQRCREYCNSYAVKKEDKEGQTTLSYPFTSTKYVNDLFKWAQIGLTTSSEKFHQTTGINCKNGVLSIVWEHSKPIAKLNPHDPEKHYFTTEPTITYNPNADAKYADQLLRCLDEKQLQILIRNLGAALDIPTVRKYKGRLIKILFCIGQGSNGKDSIREVISLIFGREQVANFSLNDFTDYDTGNKNSLAGLSKARVNWASESGKTTRIDNSLSLKRFATGDSLIERYLFKDGVEYVPNAIALFNLNELPNLFGTGQAALDRFAPLMFRKSFVKQEDYDPTNPNHELADPRFKYDREFLINEVCPAFLNYMIKGLKDLMREGIDYTCTETALDQIQSENNHLFDFISEMGWHEDPSAPPIRIGTLYEYLESWYVGEAILKTGGFDQKIWADPVKPSDKYVKGANQLFARLKEIFPNIRKIEFCPEGMTKKFSHIEGLSINPKNPPSYTPVSPPIYPSYTPVYTPVESGSNPDTVMVSEDAYTPYTPVSSKSSEKNNLTEPFAENTTNTPINVSVSYENIESSPQTGVYGVYETAETLTTQELTPIRTGVEIGVDVGYKVGYSQAAPDGKTGFPDDCPTYQQPQPPQPPTQWEALKAACSPVVLFIEDLRRGVRLDELVERLADIKHNFFAEIERLFLAGHLSLDEFNLFC